MTANVIRFLGLLLMSLLVGTTFGIWLGFDPSGLSAQAYVEQQQAAIRALNTALPLMGAACIVLSAALCVLTRNDRWQRNMLIATVVLLVAAGLVTRFANQPINSLIMTWSVQAPPANWTELRDTWWHWHALRTAAGISALILALLAAIGSRGRAP